MNTLQTLFSKKLYAISNSKIKNKFTIETSGGWFITNIVLFRHDGGHYICQADNGFAPNPVSREVRLDVHRKL